MTNHADWVPRYKRLREVRFQLNNTLVGTLSKAVIDEAGRALGMLRRGVLVFDTMDQTAVLSDYGIYNVRVGGRNAVQRYLDESPPPPGSEQRIVLESMLNAHYSILQVLDVEPGVGVSVRDKIRGETGFLVDIGFSTTAPKGMVLATRVIPDPEGAFLTTGGAALPVTREVLVVAAKGLARIVPPETDITQITPEQEAAFAALVIRNCLATEAATRIGYADPSQLSSGPQASGALTTRPRANRNDPCPCGSGRKYKTCCGRR